MAHFLICYDIANPKRLNRVHRRAVRHAIFVQYSIYYLHGTQSDLDTLLHELEEVIDKSEDDVRAYAVTPLKEAIQFGRAWLPDEVLLF